MYVVVFVSCLLDPIVPQCSDFYLGTLASSVSQAWIEGSRKQKGSVGFLYMQR